MSTTLRRLPLFAAAAVALLAGLAAGLARIGWDVPAADLSMLHGPLMVCGFFGTVIGLERAAALARPWPFAAPLLTALGGLGLVAGAPPAVAGASMLLGCAVFLAVAIVILRKQPALYTVTLALGAAAWVVGTLAWLAAGRVAPGVGAWACFLVLTIAGERLELSRFLPPSKSKAPTAALAFGTLLLGAALLAGESNWGAPIFGIGLLGQAAWMFRHDVARRTIRQSGLTRYMAACLLSGYVWLAAAGAVCITLGLPEAGPVYDAVLHSLFVGFVFAMVFGHAPVILPSVLKVKLPFHRGFYAPLALLHLSLVLRVAGDLTAHQELRQWGGLLNAVAILVFLATTAGTAAMAARR